MDRETAVSILRDQYGDVSVRLASVNASVDREVREYRRNLIAKRTYEVEKVFADKIREAYDNSGITIQDIQTVIGTSDWKRTKKWRDLAGIPSREQKRAVREYTQKYVNAPFLWNEDYTVLTIQRGIDGAVLETPVEVSNIRIQLRVMTGGIYKPYWAWDTDPELDREMSKQYPYKWHGYVTAELDRAAEVGELIRKTPESPWD